MTTKEKILGEIERLTLNGVSFIDNEFNQGYAAAMADIKDFINSLTE